VATISDQRCDIPFIASLYKAGMNVARINTAHISKEGGAILVQNIRAVSPKIAIMIDTKGPEIRTAKTQKILEVVDGQEVVFSYEKADVGLENICVNYKNFVNDLRENDNILIDDGDIKVIVIKKYPKYLHCRVENSGEIKPNKSINIPGIKTKLPSISEKDKEFIAFAVENDLDFIAHSFVRSRKDVQDLKKILTSYNSDIKIIAKIENLEGVNKIGEILEEAYGIMVARGDLGIEIPAEQIPTVQRNLIRKAILQKKPVIVATQMLHSMIEHPRPTRAEVSDVAGAIYSRTDAIMLSGETAYGKYPVEAIQTMVKIAKEVEPDRDKRYDVIIPPVNNEISAYLAHSAIRASKELDNCIIVTSTTTGKTARYLAAYRSSTPVFAKCHSHRVVRELALSFGIVPSFLEMKRNKMQIQRAAVLSLLDEGTIKAADMLIYVGGRFGEAAGASFIEISTAENLFVKRNQSV